MITKEEFALQVVRDAGRECDSGEESLELLKKVALRVYPCRCETEHCNGWKVIDVSYHGSYQKLVLKKLL